METSPFINFHTRFKIKSPELNLLKQNYIIQTFFFRHSIEYNKLIKELSEYGVSDDISLKEEIFEVAQLKK